MFLYSERIEPVAGAEVAHPPAYSEPADSFSSTHSGSSPPGQSVKCVVSPASVSMMEPGSIILTEAGETVHLTLCPEGDLPDWVEEKLSAGSE